MSEERARYEAAVDYFWASSGWSFSGSDAEDAEHKRALLAGIDEIERLRQREKQLLVMLASLARVTSRKAPPNWEVLGMELTEYLDAYEAATNEGLAIIEGAEKQA